MEIIYIYYLLGDERMKKYIIAIFIFLIITAAMFSQPIKQTFGIVKEDNTPLTAILDELDGEFYEVVVLAWGKVNDKYMTVQEIKDTLVAVQETYYNTQSTPKFYIENNYKSCEWNVKFNNNKAAQFIIQSYQPTTQTPELKPESYFLVEIAQKDNDFKPEDLKQEVISYYKKLGAIPEISLTYTARIKGRITSTEGRNYINKVKKILELSDVEETFVADYYAVNGYSKKFKDVIIVAGKKQNFRLVMRYNLEDDYTYVIFGTPDIGGQD